MQPHKQKIHRVEKTMEFTAMDDLSCLFDRHEKSCLRKPEKRSRKRRRVTFAMATEYTFQVGYGESTLPDGNLPGVGLCGTPIKVESSGVKDDSRGMVYRYSLRDRYLLLQRAGFTRENILALMHEQQKLHESRVCSVVEQITDKCTSRDEELEMIRRVRQCLMTSR
ncbi:unnamed protein product [Aphanomyces euteiches]